jgi:hypothetical protein
MSGTSDFHRTFPVALLLATLVCPIMAQNSPAPIPEPAARLPHDYTFNIDAHVPWNDTGLDLMAGELVHVYGATSVCGGPIPGQKYELPLPSAPAGALLVKLHAESDAVLASPDAEFPIIFPSHLFFGVNGVRCTGTVPVKVHIEWQPGKAPAAKQPS